MSLICLCFFTTTISSVVKADFFELVSWDPYWVKAMRDEIHVLKLNHTWDIIPLPSDNVPISYKWVYKVKLKADGSVERYKAHLVAKRYN